MSLPALTDEVSEPEEQLRIQLYGSQEPPVGPAFAGTVPAPS